MKKVFTRQIFLCSSIYLLVGLYGYFTFPYEETGHKSNFLTRYAPKSHIPILVAIIIMTAVIFVAQPFNIIPCQESFFSLMFPNQEQSNKSRVLFTLGKSYSNLSDSHSSDWNFSWSSLLQV